MAKGKLQKKMSKQKPLKTMKEKKQAKREKKKKENEKIINQIVNRTIHPTVIKGCRGGDTYPLSSACPEVFGSPIYTAEEDAEKKSAPGDPLRSGAAPANARLAQRKE